MDTSPGSTRRPTWVIIGIIIAVLGIALSFYSVMHHVEVRASGQTDAACNINETFSCDEVALSKYAEPIAGIPLGVFGLGYFVAQIVLLGIGLGTGKNAREHLQAYVAMVAIGVVVSVVLGGISVTALGNYCLTCIGIYTLCLAQAAVVFIGRKDVPRPFDFKGVVGAGATAAIAVAAVIAAFNFLRPDTKAPSTAANPTTAPELSAKAEDIPLSKSAYSGLGEDYRKGGDGAAVVIHEFVDFQCPACQRITGILDALQKEYGDKVLVVLRNYPLDNSCNSSIQGKMHEYACQSAVLARCAGQYGKFWEMHDRLFAGQKDINDVRIKDWAKQTGLTQEQIDGCLASKDLLEKVKDDIALGNKLGVDSTPTLFINGRKVLGGRDLDGLRAQIDQQLN